MTGLEQVKTTLADALERAGIRAVTAYEPGWCKRYSQPVTAVGFRQGECRGEAMNSYLGSQVDPGTQETREVYGMRLELKLSLDIYAPASVGAAGCDKTLEGLHQVMLEGLPSGLRPSELRWEETVWDQDTAMFLRRGSLSCGAYFTAAATEEGVLLSDFILKGVITT